LRDGKLKQILCDLGRTQTQRDVEAAVREINEERRVGAILWKQATADRTRKAGEFETFLDDIANITGFRQDSKAFWLVVFRTLGKRMARAFPEERQHSNLMLDGDDQRMGDW
jgi:hypothetical protein